MPGNKVTPSCAHSAITAALSIFRIASSNFLVKASTSPVPVSGVLERAIHPPPPSRQITPATIHFSAPIPIPHPSFPTLASAPTLSTVHWNEKPAVPLHWQPVDTSRIIGDCLAT